ncbi:MAG: hypothetical protein RJA71_414 [Actinomycetota bacterium]
MATSTVKPARLGLDREVVLYGLVKVRSTARSETIGGGWLEGQIGHLPPPGSQSRSGLALKIGVSTRKKCDF